MRFELDRTTIIFVLFVIVIAALFGINQFVQNQPPIAVMIVVDPLAESWAKAAASEFNNSSPVVNGTVRIQVQIQVMDDLDIWRGNPNWTSQSHPAAWLPSSSLSLSYLTPNIRMTPNQASLARSPLVWGGFSNRVAILTNNDERPFEWSAVQEIAAAARWQNLGVSNDPSNVNMAINYPTGSMAGLGVLMTAAANYSSTNQLDPNTLSDGDFLAWWQPIKDAVFNSQRLGANPAATMASRGAGAADFGLLPEVLWLQNASELGRSGFVFAYPEYQFILDFPYAVWDDTQTDANIKAGAESFGAFLLGDSGQALALAHGLRPANSEPTTTASLFNAAASYGILLEPDYGLEMIAPSRSFMDALLALVN